MILNRKMANLPEHIQEKLAQLPEVGMDRQVVNLHMPDGTVHRGVLVSGCRFAFIEGVDLDSVSDVTITP